MTPTREEILALEAGQDLDRLISIHVMGFEIRKEYLADQSYHEYYYREGYKYENVNYPDEWQPSRFIDVAWEVLEQFKQYTVMKAAGWEKEYDCRIWVGITGDQWSVQAKTAPEAICKAALLAKLNL
jgi:hypothetical protein